MTWINGRWIDTPQYGSGEGDYIEVGSQPYVPKHRGEPKVVYRVHYVESERGWGRTEWNTDYDTHDEASKAVYECNKDNPTGFVPDYYIQAQYVGKVTL